MKITKFDFQSNKPVFVYKGLKVYDTKHAIQRRLERASDLTDKDFETIFKRMINKILADREYFDAATDYLFYSVSYKQGLVVHYIYPIIRVITILPKEKYRPKPKTIGVLIEQHLHEYNVITDNEEVLGMLLSLIPEFELTEIQQADYYDYDFIKDPEFDLEFYFVDGKLYDINKEVVII